MAGEVTTLEHELGDDTVEAGANVALALGLLAELTEVGSSLGDHVLIDDLAFILPGDLLPGSRIYASNQHPCRKLINSLHWLCCNLGLFGFALLSSPTPGDR